MESGLPSSLIVLVSSVASGVSLTGLTNMDTGAWLLSSVPSEALKLKISKPL
jgi:hypothetical protein